MMQKSGSLDWNLMPYSWTHVVAIGASAGGVQAVSSLFSALPSQFPAPIIVAIHSRETIMLTELLGRRSRLPTELVENGTSLKAGRIYICPGGIQTVLASARVLTMRPREDERFTPSIDALFGSMADLLGSRAIGVVMSGMLNDGTAGARALARECAKIYVQCPEEAQHPSMPNGVIDANTGASILPAVEIAVAINDLVSTPAPAIK